MRTRQPLRCVQATAAATTARFRMWTEPAGERLRGLDRLQGPLRGVRGHAPRQRARAADDLAARRDVPARARPARVDAAPQLALAPGQLGPVRRARRGRGAARARADRARADAARHAPAPRGPAARRGRGPVRRGGLDDRDAPRPAAAARRRRRRRRRRDLRLARQPAADPPRPLPHDAARARRCCTSTSSTSPAPSGSRSPSGSSRSTSTSSAARCAPAATARPRSGPRRPELYWPPPVAGWCNWQHTSLWIWELGFESLPGSL